MKSQVTVMLFEASQMPVFTFSLEEWVLKLAATAVTATALILLLLVLHRLKLFSIKKREKAAIK
ncbi:MAG: hypothetical protein NZ954_02175 [Thermofilaceae archaeon]|nr:hypothetical protein [Thermofilaceae archaeon]MCX8180915.1 hypothetical protein [Thermofilaceae archaeon]MDW8003480.1 hypothetical protein [Thermofilaceae archaeon]